MEPTLREDDKVVVNRFAYFFIRPKEGDVVVVYHPKDRRKKMIKRIKKSTHLGYFLIGDNLNKSTDSRNFGVVQKKDIIGKVITKLQ